MALIEDFDRNTLHRFVQDNIELGSMVCTDGLNSYRELKRICTERQQRGVGALTNGRSTTLFL